MLDICKAAIVINAGRAAGLAAIVQKVTARSSRPRPSSTEHEPRHAGARGAHISAIRRRRKDASHRRTAHSPAQRPGTLGQRSVGLPVRVASHDRWTDGFHTGYVLEALQLCRGLLQRDDLAEPIARGMDYYLRTFLRNDGVVPYYANGSGPLDVNNFAQMVVTLQCVRST